jgi:hypothetical protein
VGWVETACMELLVLGFQNWGRRSNLAVIWVGSLPVALRVQAT